MITSGPWARSCPQHCIIQLVGLPPLPYCQTSCPRPCTLDLAPDLGVQGWVGTEPGSRPPWCGGREGEMPGPQILSLVYRERDGVVPGCWCPISAWGERRVKGGCHSAQSWHTRQGEGGARPQGLIWPTDNRTSCTWLTWPEKVEHHCLNVQVSRSKLSQPFSCFPFPTSFFSP